jgi:hypothetical protein
MLCTILCAVVGVIAMLTVLVAAMASGANASRAQVRRIKLTMIVTVILGIGCIVGGILLTRSGRPMAGCIVALGPAVLVVVMMVWLTVVQERNRRPPG